MANGNSLFVLFCLVLQGDVTIQAKSQFFYVQLRLITARKRCLGQGNIFIGVCQKFCSQVGGVSARGGGVCFWGVSGGDPPDGYCCGRYASYWNAFLYMYEF